MFFHHKKIIKSPRSHSSEKGKASLVWLIPKLILLDLLYFYLASSFLFFYLKVLKSEVDDLKSTLMSTENQLHAMKKNQNENNIEAARKYAALESKVYNRSLHILQKHLLDVFLT